MSEDGFAAFASELASRRRALGCHLLVTSSVGSSNLLARHLANRLREWGDPVPDLAVVAWEQTAGRGRLERSWVSTAGLGVYCSLVLSASRVAATGLHRLPVVVAVALAQRLREWSGRVALKWPNDLVVEGRKLGGILIETLGSGSENVAIVGFGINLHQEGDALPTERSISLRLVLEDAEPRRPPPGLAGLTSSLVASVLERAPSVSGEQIEETLATYRELLVHRPGDPIRCQISDEIVDGELEGVDDEGRLVLVTRSGRRTVSAADVLESASERG